MNLGGVSVCVSLMSHVLVLIVLELYSLEPKQTPASKRSKKGLRVTQRLSPLLVLERLALNPLLLRP
jgi:hypothetical protein